MQRARIQRTSRYLPSPPASPPSHSPLLLSLWAFSIWLEAIAIVPQLILLQRHKCVENITSWYVFSLGAYRGLYIINWIYRYFTEPHYRSWVAWIAGTIQTLFYADFFYYFVMCKVRKSARVGAASLYTRVSWSGVGSHCTAPPPPTISHIAVGRAF